MRAEEPGAAGDQHAHMTCPRISSDVIEQMSRSITLEEQIANAARPNHGEAAKVTGTATLRPRLVWPWAAAPGDRSGAGQPVVFIRFGQDCRHSQRQAEEKRQVHQEEGVVHQAVRQRGDHARHQPQDQSAHLPFRQAPV